MSSTSKKQAAAARRARVEELRRAEQAREKRIRILAVAVSTVVLAGVLGGGWYLIDSAADDEGEESAPAKVKGEQTFDDLGRDHVDTPVDYPQSPPVGGDHRPVWLNCDSEVYTKEVQKENAVHSLEHGAVWITYTEKAAKDDVKALTDRVNQTPYTFISPYRDQSAPIVLSAWGHQLKVNDSADPRVAQFLEKYVQGEQTPEPGASCTGGSTA